MEYNTGRSPLLISEYGRHVQKMIQHAMTLKDRDERNKAAKAIIGVMGQVNPHLRDVYDFRHKLWDHLFIMSGFQLDVDSPFPIPSPQSFITKPEMINYPSYKVRFRHYGKITESLINVACEYSEGTEKKELTNLIANQMKKSYLLWNNKSITDDIIFSDLKKISQGKLELSPDTVLSQPNEMVLKPAAKEFKGGGKRKNQRGGQRKRY